MDEEWLEERSIAISKQIQWIAHEEARSVFVQRFAARGGLTAQKEKLIDDAEKILNRLKEDL